MEQNMKFRMLESIGTVYEEAKKCKLAPAFFEKVDSELKYLSEYFKVSPNQSLIIAMVFALNYKGRNVDLKDLIEYFDCNPMKLLEFSDDFEELYSKGILAKEISDHEPNLVLVNDQFYVNKKISEAILNNKSFPKIEKEVFKDVVQFLSNISELGWKREQREISTNQLLVQTEYLISSYLSFPVIKKVNDFQLNKTDAFVYLYLMWNTLSGCDGISINVVERVIFDNRLEGVSYIQEIINNNCDYL
jgi:hypothetical protein